MNSNVLGMQNTGGQLNQMRATAESLFSNQLASALSTMGDSQFFQDSISPTTVRQQLATSDPSNMASTPVLMNSMKWLLASMSKGRDVSDFFPHVVKLVSCPSLEMRKMVYTYLTHYADHNASCRDLALLSINTFQRDLSTTNDNIRPLALRVLTSIRVMDVLQIQILAVQTCGKDISPHVRKCAANALAKLYPRCDDDNKQRLKDMLRNILLEENSTIVLSSAVISFVEMCPNELDMLHGSYRKLCHLLTDLEEWGQIVCLDVLARYCRTYFRSPEVSNGVGSAEMIDRQRRVSRQSVKSSSSEVLPIPSLHDSIMSPIVSKEPMKIKEKKRIVKKGFYSDEEDESTDDDNDVSSSIPISMRNEMSLASRMRSPNVGRKGHIIGFGTSDDESSNQVSASTEEDSGLQEDHRLLLNSSLPLLKSRNSAVVLGVCSLHYHCGIASIKIRSSLGKALVRIYHDRREIQYVVLNSIRMLVRDCPSAFAPYLNDFFVKAMDPSFTRLIKLGILVDLCLEENSIKAVLNELTTYIRNDDKAFVCASIQTVGKVIEMARIFYTRQGEKSGNTKHATKKSNSMALNCLQSITTLMEASDDIQVIAHGIEVAQHILIQLSSSEKMSLPIDDPLNIRGQAVYKFLVLMIRFLTNDEDAASDDLSETGVSGHQIPVLDSSNLAPALWIIGDWVLSDSLTQKIYNIEISEKKVILSDLLRLLGNKFNVMDQNLKCQAVHFAAKTLISSKGSADDEILCELILSLGRLDVHLNVRDKSRNESLLIHMTKGLVHDTENIPVIPPKNQLITIANVKGFFFSQVPTSSWISVDGTDQYRFGTLSSMVSHTTGASYIALPPWADADSSPSLRDPPANKDAKSKSKGRSVIGTESSSYGWLVDSNKIASSTFYDSDDSSDDKSSSSSEDSDDSSSESSSSSSSESSDSSDESSDGESTSSDETNIQVSRPVQIRSPSNTIMQSSDESSESSSSSSTSNPVTYTSVSTNISNDLLNMKYPTKFDHNAHDTSTISQGLEGLVMAPIILSKDEISKSDVSYDGSLWEDVIRSDLSGGLSVKIRYLRSSARTREARLLGLDPLNPSVICVQFLLENTRIDNLSIRRIKIFQKKISGSGHIPTVRVILPQEIMSLDGGKSCFAIMGLEFANPTDKEGGSFAKFEMKCDRSISVIDIKPPLAEMLQKSSISNIESFQSVAKTLNGIYQQSKSDIQVKNKDQVIEKILSSSSVALVHRWVDDTCRFSGKLPASGVDVLLEISCNDSGNGELIVFCDNAMAVNSLLVYFRDIFKTL